MQLNSNYEEQYEENTTQRKQNSLNCAQGQSVIIVFITLQNQSAPSQMTMDAFRKAGCDAHLLNWAERYRFVCICHMAWWLWRHNKRSVIKTIMTDYDHVHMCWHCCSTHYCEKFELFNDYLERIVHSIAYLKISATAPWFLSLSKRVKSSDSR